VRLNEIEPDEYATSVLPLTAELWAGRRSFEHYVSHTLEIAHSGYGRRYYRTLGLYDDRQLVASMKRYERSMRFGQTRLRALGIGAVFTPPELRGRGYASAMLAMQLDRARNEGYDFAFLFSDIRPRFYEDLGFRTLASRAISLRADTLANQRIEVTRLEEGDWSAVRRCFDLCERTRTWGFVRTPLIWEWIRLRVRQGAAHPVGQETNLVVRRGRGIAAYVFGARSAEHDAYILDEYGFADQDGRELIGPLLRSAAGDLRRISGWLPPDGARNALPKASVRKRRDAVLMALPLSSNGHKWFATASQERAGDLLWSSDHI
jgi:predicted N-acetyltransferase YhbS